MSNDPGEDKPIRHDEILWRRILSRKAQPHWYKFENGEWRPTSVAFMDNRTRTHSLSAYISSETDLDRLRRDYPNDNIAGFPAHVPLSFSHTIERVVEQGYESHVEITPPAETWGNETKKRHQRKTAAREMARVAQWVYFCDEEVVP